MTLRLFDAIEAPPVRCFRLMRCERVTLLLAARIEPDGADGDFVLEEGQAHCGEARSFAVRDALEREMILFVPGAPLPDAGSGVLGAAKPRRAPVHRMPGQQIDDVCRRSVERLRDLRDAEVPARYGLVELCNGDAVRGRPR